MKQRKRVSMALSFATHSYRRSEHTRCIVVCNNIYFVSGCLTGHKLSGIRMRLTDGAHHIVDSSEYAFNLAAQGAVQDGESTCSVP